MTDLYAQQLDQIRRTELSPPAPNPWIQTHSGRQWFILNPHPSNVHLPDVVWAMSHLCRFTGHTRHFYSVLQHSVYVARLLRSMGAPPNVVLHGAFHDASEGYLVDVPSPLKAVLPGYQDMEQRTQEAIIRHMGLGPLLPEEKDMVHQADMTMLATEKRDLMAPCVAAWQPIAEPPMVARIEPLMPAGARHAFVRLMIDLGCHTLASQLEKLD
jgi:hypothetical protein